MKRIQCWGIKNKQGKFVLAPIRDYWEADRTLLFRTRKQAQAWLLSNQFWNPKGEVVKLTITVKEYGT